MRNALVQTDEAHLAFRASSSISYNNIEINKLADKLYRVFFLD